MPDAPHPARRLRFRRGNEKPRQPGAGQVQSNGAARIDRNELLLALGQMHPPPGLGTGGHQAHQRRAERHAHALGKIVNAQPAAAVRPGNHLPADAAPRLGRKRQLRSSSTRCTPNSRATRTISFSTPSRNRSSATSFPSSTTSPSMHEQILAPHSPTLGDGKAHARDEDERLPAKPRGQRRKPAPPHDRGVSAHGRDPFPDRRRRARG